MVTFSSTKEVSGLHMRTKMFVHLCSVEPWLNGMRFHFKSLLKHAFNMNLENDNKITKFRPASNFKISSRDITRFHCKIVMCFYFIFWLLLFIVKQQFSSPFLNLMKTNNTCILFFVCQKGRSRISVSYNMSF